MSAIGCSDSEEGDETQDGGTNADTGGDAASDPVPDAGPDLIADPIVDLTQDLDLVEDLPAEEVTEEVGGDAGTDLPAEEVVEEDAIEEPTEEPTEFCGNGVREGDEACDETDFDGDTCADFGIAFGTPSCTETCEVVTTSCRALAVCNDGFVDGDESCEDGNTEDFDGCSADCQLETCDPEGDSDDDDINDCDDEEECDGVDNNGNGAVDEFPVDEGIGDACYTGPEETRNVGTCTDGVLACRLGEIVCVGDVTPQVDELCNDLDDDCDDQVPPGEAEAGCDTDVIIGDDPFSARFEIRTPPRAVDVVLNIDTTGSMGGALEGVREELRDIIVPGVEEVLADAAFAVTTFEDYPFGDFGDPGDVPFQLWQRVTSSIDAVQEGLDAITLGSGNDTPESGIESLYQIAVGSGVRWPVGAVVAFLPDGQSAFLGERPLDDADDYEITLGVGDELVAEVIANRAGSSLDPYLTLYDSTGAELTSNDDDETYDSLLTFTATEAGTYVLRVSACCSEGPSWGSSSGWYGLRVTVGETVLMPEAGTCSALEVGVDSFVEGTEARVPLVPEADARPYDLAACREDCLAIADLNEAWLGAYCGIEAGECGNGILNTDEECDDNNAVDDDGCTNECLREFYAGVPAFDPRPGFSTALGHGRIGGVGFRAGSVPVVLQITDARSHDGPEYSEYVDLLDVEGPFDAHTALQAFDSLDAIGARIIGIDTGGAIGGDPDDLTFIDAMVVRSGSIVPLCAFDGSAARIGGQCLETECCTGLDGAGVAPLEGDTCPLTFEVSSSGTGLSTAIVQAVDTLANFAGEQYTGRIVAAEGVPEAVLCMIGELDIVDVARPGECLPELETIDLDEDGFDETVLNATPSTRATFTFTAVNRDRFDVDDDENETEPCIEPGAYAVTFQLVDVDEDIIFAQQVNITVLAPEL